MTALESRSTAAKSRDWREILLNRKMLICIVQGFASGLPLYVLIQLVPAWLRSRGVDLATIGLFGLIQLPYTWKFFWAPVMDCFAPLQMGRRRGWMLLTQVLLLSSIAALGGLQPEFSLRAIVWLVTAVALFSASQDIVLDAYRRELLRDDELGTGNSLFINAYRLSSLVPGSLALILSDMIPWSAVFPVTALFMAVGIGTTLVIRESTCSAAGPQSLEVAVIAPLREFFSRGGTRRTVAVLSFMLLYKLGDSMATALSTPFYLDMGFSRTEIGAIAKIAALWASAAGALLGGIAMLRVSINRALWLFGCVQLLSIPGFAILAEVGHEPAVLFGVVSFEYFGVGLGTVALTAFMARETDTRFTATQFALLSSLATVPRVVAGAGTGYIIEAIGYTQFFLLCTAIALPGMLMLLWVAPWNGTQTPRPGLFRP